MLRNIPRLLVISHDFRYSKSFVCIYDSFISLNLTNFNTAAHVFASLRRKCRRTCPKGVDPYPSAAGESEEQLIDCACPETCSGSLLLGFRGHTTRPVPFDASAELVKHRLEVRSLQWKQASNLEQIPSFVYSRSRCSSVEKRSGKARTKYVSEELFHHHML